MNLNHALAVRSDHSIGESLLQTDHITKKAKELGYESVMVVDTMSISSMPDLAAKAKKQGIKSLVGCRLRVYADPTYRLPSKASGEVAKPNPMFMPKVYALNENGFKSIMKLLTKGSSPEYFYYHSRVGLVDLLALEDVAVSTGDLFNLFHLNQASNVLTQLQMRFGNDKVFVELVPIDTPLFDTLNAKALTIARSHAAPTLVTYPTLYQDDGDAKSLEVLTAIATNDKMDSPWRSVQFVQDFYFQEPKHILDRVRAASARVAKWNGVSEPLLWVGGVKNIETLVGMCDYQFKKLEPCLPKMADNEFALLGKKCIDGWKRRFAQPVMGYLPPKELIPVYQERLQFELATLKKMGFAGYFLLVEDLVMWAKTNGVIVGPGRGSVGGSLVAYLLGITDVDPIRFDLLFERFINPERLDLPDADLDFMSSKRHLVVEYLTGKYGADRVAGISNYSTLASASALRDAGRVFGLSGFDLMATKLVPKEHGQSYTLEEAAKAVPDIDKFRSEHPKVWGHALKLEGCMRSLGQHAAGVIVAGEPLVERAVVETRSESPVVNWDKRIVEDWGLIKMDLLGLSTLDVMEIAKQYVRERHGKTIDYTRLPLEEPDIMSAFGRGDTTGVFQAEGHGARKMLREIAKGGTLTFNDIVAMNALNRPGPLDSGLADSYIRRRQGVESVSYPHPRAEKALEATLGVLVYQESLMQISRDLCGFTMPEADTLRKAIGKKDAKLMETMKDQFINGAVVGFAKVESEDGRVVEVSLARKFKVKGRDSRHTIEEIFAEELELDESL